MGYLEGLLGGFTQRRQQVEQENLQLAQQQNEREAKVYSALLSSPDPEIQALAATGMLSSAVGPKRAGGLRGWLGEMTQNPIMGQIQALINQPVAHTETTPAALPSRSITGVATTPPTTAAQPTTETTTPGAAPPKTLAPDVSLRMGPMSRPQPTTRTTMVPRQVFQTPEQAMLAGKRAAAQGDVEGEIAGLVASGYTEEQARALIKAKYERAYRGSGAGTVQSIAGENSRGEPMYAVFDRETGSPTFGQYLDPDTRQPIADFRPRTTTGGRAITDRESLARELFGKPAASLSPAEMATVNQRLVTYGGQKAGAIAEWRAVAAAHAPLSAPQRREAIADLSKQWTTINASVREMQRQNLLIKTGLDRYNADPVGGSEAIIATFKKILDPESVVRESEYQRTPDSLDLADRLRGMVEKYGQGGGAGVPREVLAEMVQTADALVESMKGWNQSSRARIAADAQDAQIDPFLVLGADWSGGSAPSAQVGQRPPAITTGAGGGVDDFEAKQVNGVWTIVRKGGG